MSLKQLIRKQALAKEYAIVNDYEFVMPGEPMIYSLKYPIGRRQHSDQHFRNKKFRSFLKCFFRSYLLERTPVVLIVKFFVTPMEGTIVSHKAMRSDKFPAVQSPEICDYLLSFLETLFKVLIKSYRQICKIDAEKYYSDQPRTVMKFMSYAEYVNLQDHNPDYAKTKGQCTARSTGILQPELHWHEESSIVY